MSTPPDQEVPLDNLALGGDAVGRLKGGDGPADSRQVVFVPFGAPGDRAVLHRWEQRKNFARGWIQSLAAPAPHRTSPPCPHFYKPGDAPDAVCGGCNWQHLAYEFQTRSKRQLLIEAFQRLGRIAKPAVEETLSAPAPWRYRNKVQIPFAPDSAGGLRAGFYAPNSHRIVPFDDCLVQTEESVRVFKAVLDWFRQNPAPAYDEDSRRGWLRHLLVRTNSQNEALVALITKGDNFPKAVAFAEHLTKQCPSVKSLFQNVNPREDHVILGPEWRHLHGKHYLTETLLGLRFRLSPGSFFQVNSPAAEILYKKVESFIEPTPEESVLELYSGVGAIAQLLAKRSRFVWGVEENPAAVADAIESAKWNTLKNVKFVQDRCETALARGRFKKGLNDRLAAVVLDPPRAGCEQHVLRAVIRLAPRKIVYVSCDPATLARDARYLATGGYLLRRSAPVDLFPQTSHIESVSLFARSHP